MWQELVLAPGSSLRPSQSPLRSWQAGWRPGEGERGLCVLPAPAHQRHRHTVPKGCTTKSMRSLLRREAGFRVFVWLVLFHMQEREVDLRCGAGRGRLGENFDSSIGTGMCIS